MGKLKFIIPTIIAIIVGVKIKSLLSPPPVPKLENTWWGPGDGTKQDTSIRPFKITFSEKAIQDLQYRLDNHRPFTPPLEGIQQQYGFNTNLLKEIVDFWRTKYDWKKREKYLNKYPQFVTNIQGLDIHYIRVAPENPQGKRVLPLLLLHGWPGSIREFYEIIPLLTTPQKDRDFVFEVIVAHLPGYGYSQAAVRPGLGPGQMAVVFKNLMERLGFQWYYVQGGDFGGIVLQYMSVLFPEHVKGFHCNMCTVYTPLAGLKRLLGSLYSSWVVKPEHYNRVYPLKEQFERTLRETGYLHLQATKPDTLGVGVSDSPVGLAAYILEKFTTGTNGTWQFREDGGLKLQYSYTDLLDNIMIYWMSGSITTSFRLYSETFNKANTEMGVGRMPVLVPTACARFSNDFYAPDGIIKEIYPKLVHLSDYEGGHFAAFQLPKVLAEDVFIAVEKFEDFHKIKKF